MSHTKTTQILCKRARQMLLASGIDDFIQVDDQPKLSEAEDATWVQAWIRVPHDQPDRIEQFVADAAAELIADGMDADDALAIATEAAQIIREHLGNP